MNWKQFLTEKVLREPEAASEYIVANNGDLVSVKTVIKNHTFDNDADMMALYRAIYKKGKWINFVNFTFLTRPVNGKCDAWLFCLGGEDYEARCCLVAQWLEVKK